MKTDQFHFKQFSVSHHISSMKVGVDGVLTGAWAPASPAARILDAGCGCGVIALMMAQRNRKAFVDALDIDPMSVEEAAGNFRSSPWRNMMEAINDSWSNFTLNTSNRYDIIVSNPPYFSSGIISPDSRRLAARHQGELSPLTLLEYGARILTQNGRIAMISPAGFIHDIVKKGRAEGFSLSRHAFVKGHQSAPVKRVMLEFTKENFNELVPIPTPSDSNTLILETSPGNPTDEYRKLCHDFYLKF